MYFLFIRFMLIKLKHVFLNVILQKEQSYYIPIDIDKTKLLVHQLKIQIKEEKQTKNIRISR